jgi:hypothetical protein
MRAGVRLFFAFNFFKAGVGLSILLAAGKAVEIIRQPLTALAHPPDLLPGVADDKGVVGNILGHHCAGPDETVAAERVAANNRRIRANRGARL